MDRKNGDAGLKIPAAVVLMAILVGLGCRGTIKRNYTWKDDYMLWMDTVNKSFQKARPHNEVGNAYTADGTIGKAIDHYKTALKLKHYDPAGVNYNLGLAYHNIGLLDKAEEHYRAAMNIRDFPEPHNNMGNIYWDNGLIDKAIEEYRLALKLDPNHSEAKDNLRRILEKYENKNK